MNLSKAIATYLGAIKAWWYWTLGLIAAAAFAVPPLEESTKEDPTGGAGIYAPIVALCAAAILLSEAMNAGELRIRRIPSFLLASAAWPAPTCGSQTQPKPTPPTRNCHLQWW